MKKLVIVGLSAVLALLAVEPAHAQDQKVLAIIDTAIDSKKIPAVIYEACFTVNRSCPNKTAFMEGVGSANSTAWPADIRKDTYHGYNMTQAALAINPNIKIVFVRIADISAAGNSGNQPQSLSLAIDWVSKNASKYSIDAVSISQSGTSKNNLLACSSDVKTINAISSLNAQNIPTFAATGNNKSQTMVGFPSCVNGVVPVAAIDPTGKISSLSNYSSAVKIVANVCATFSGEICVKTPDYAGVMRAQSGTSISTPLAVAKLINAWSGQNWNELINGLPKNGTAGQIK
jgi:hypothetical protein